MLTPWNPLIAAAPLLNTPAFGDPAASLLSRHGKAAGSCRLRRAAFRLPGQIDAGRRERHIAPDEGKNGIIK